MKIEINDLTIGEDNSIWRKTENIPEVFNGYPPQQGKIYFTYPIHITEATLIKNIKFIQEGGVYNLNGFIVKPSINSPYWECYNEKILYLHELQQIYRRKEGKELIIDLINLAENSSTDITYY